MPPIIPDSPPPTGRGEDARRWLRSQGILDYILPIRSRDWDLIKDPFQFYLSRRLCLAPALSYSEALSAGGWFHKRLELLRTDPSLIPAMMESFLSDRISEIREVAKNFAISGDTRQRYEQSTKEDFYNAWSWFEVAASIPLTGKLGTFQDFLTRPYWEDLGSEILLTHQEAPRMALICQLDRLLYHTQQKTLWILDAKTCTESPNIRLSACTLEMQTWHYMYILKKLVESGKISELYPQLPRDVRLGGMIHLGIQKPTIRMSMSDRHFTLDETPFKSGPRKGQPRNEKIYFGEPDPENYRRRCRDWYNGVGEYSHLSPEREASPPVNLSFTEASLLDDMVLSEYRFRLSEINRWRQFQAVPENFPRRTPIMPTGKLSIYAPFYFSSVQQWPSIIQEERFILGKPTDPESIYACQEIPQAVA